MRYEIKDSLLSILYSQNLKYEESSNNNGL